VDEKIRGLEPSIPFVVRITGAGALGLGFLVDDTHIVTCAHVVKDVLNLDDYPSAAPSGTVTVDFPYLSGATKLTAHVLVWHPRISDGGRINDIAVLTLDTRKPEAAPSAPLKRSEKLFDHTFWAFGYTAKYAGGIWSHGTMCPPLPNGLLQIENSKDKGIAIERGFSGTPVWDVELNSVVGMVVEASLRRGDTQQGGAVGAGIAFVMPTDVLVDAWPDLEKISRNESEKIGTPPAYVSYNKGNSLLTLGRYDDAIACYDKALAIDPGFAGAWSNKGTSLNNLGRYGEAIPCFDKALAIDPGIAIAWNNKGNSIDNLGRYEEALVCFDKALAIDPDYRNAWYNKGISLNNLGRHEEALVCYDKALAIDPGFAFAWHNKGISLQKIGRQKEAENCFEKANALGIKT
jgi:hypothetical protein